ncbi:hypothetical protein C8R48DRAFT_135120 [Suillus tomentosus]|nr:hypothetical protein C8R48DRAFT_135120 [Suillus tomentosus]
MITMVLHIVIILGVRTNSCTQCRPHHDDWLTWPIVMSRLEFIGDVLHTCFIRESKHILRGSSHYLPKAPILLDQFTTKPLRSQINTYAMMYTRLHTDWHMWAWQRLQFSQGVRWRV